MAETPEEAKATLERRLLDIPQNIWPQTQKGFRVADSLDEDKLKKYISETLSTLTSRGLRERPEPIAGADLSDDEAKSLLLVVSLTFAALMDINASLQDFLDLGSEKLFNKDGERGAEIIASHVIDHRPDLQKSSSETALAAAILPSLEHFDLEIDMRVRFKDGELEKHSPVVVIHISTDCDSEDLWFQLNKNEIAPIIEKLKKASEDILLAEKLIQAAKSK